MCKKGKTLKGTSLKTGKSKDTVLKKQGKKHKYVHTVHI